jgi:hypothetical protein
VRRDPGSVISASSTTIMAVAEVLLPRLERPTVQHAELHDGHGATAEAFQVPVLDVEIVRPLENEVARQGVSVPGDEIFATADWLNQPTDHL